MLAFTFDKHFGQKMGKFAQDVNNGTFEFGAFFTNF